MGSKNLRSSGSSASGLKGGLKAWLHKDKGTEISTEECTEKKVHLFSRKKRYSVSRSPDFSWEITRYEKQPGYESARAEFEKRRNIEVEIPEIDTRIQTVSEKKQEPLKNIRTTVPTLDEYFKEESIRAETKAAVRPEVKSEVRTFKQKSLFDREPTMVEAVEEDKTFEGLSYFSGVSSSVEVATCSTAVDASVQQVVFDEFGSEDAPSGPQLITEFGCNEQCNTIIEISPEEAFIAELCDDLATFTVMNDILPEVMAEEEFAESEIDDGVDDSFIEDLCEDLVAKFIVDELMPELLRKREVESYVPDYVISEFQEPQISETYIEIPEIVSDAKEESTSDVTSFLFGFGRPTAQKNGTTGFRFVFGNCDDIDYDDEEVASVSVNDAAITASSLPGEIVRL